MSSKQFKEGFQKCSDNTKMFILLYYLKIFVLIQHGHLYNMGSALDNSNCVIQALWCKPVYGSCDWK